MARQDAKQRDANLAAVTVQIAELFMEFILNGVADRKTFINRLKACQEIAFQCVDKSQEGEFGESLAAIEGYQPPEGTDQLSEQQTGG